MIIDFLDKYPIEEQDKILYMAERWYIHEYRRSGTAIDLYGVFNDAPYWGDGECRCKGKCPNGGYDRTECEDYEDSNYHDWFDGIIEKHEKEQIDEIEEQIIRQIELFKEDDEWAMVYTDITLRFMKWLNEKDITYCIIRGLVDQHDYIFLKNFYPDSEYRLLFSTPTAHDMKYAVDIMGWVSYNVRDLTNMKFRKQEKEIISWIKENNAGIIHQWNSGALLFENEIDAMAIKLRWADYDKI